jgi:RHS repeat-associated protein
VESVANTGNNTQFFIGKAAGWPKKRTVIKFYVSEAVPTNAMVLSAQMKLYYYSASNGGGGSWVDRWVQAHELLQLNFDEQWASRENRTIDIPWYSPYAALNDFDAKATMESTLLFWQSELSELPKWKSWDLTALTQKWLNTPASNYGVILWATNEDVAGYTMRFYSSEATNSSDRPYLEVVWSNTPKTVYFLKDHLGSIRATVLDSATAPVIGYDDYDPWGYPLALRTKAIPNAYLQGASKNKFTGKERDDELGLNLDYSLARSYDFLMGRWVTIDPLALKYPSLTPYNFVSNNPLVFIDPNGTDWFYYQAEGEDEATWHYHEGKKATYINTKGKPVTTTKGYEYLVKYTITGKNEAGAEIGSIQLYKQNELVLNATGVFTGGVGLKPIPEGNYMMRLDVRDSEGPQSIVFKPDGPNAAPHWGIQAIPNRYVEGYDVGGAYGTGRIRLNQVDENLMIIPIQKEGYFYHGKLNNYNFTHGCACDRSQALFNYFWSGAGKDYRGRAPFWVIKNK